MGKISRLIDFEGSESSREKNQRTFTNECCHPRPFPLLLPHATFITAEKWNQIKLDVREKILLTNIADVVFSNIHILDIRDDEKKFRTICI